MPEQQLRRLFAAFGLPAMLWKLCQSELRTARDFIRAPPGQ
jgi:hypothetical protein